MILKNSFIKLQIEDLKRRVWSIALSMLAFIVLLPIFCALNISNFQSVSVEELEWIMLQLVGLVGPGNYLIITATIICAVICGLSGFFYLHSRKKVDFYHSIPVRRERLFFTCYLNGVLIYVIPYILNLIFSLIIIGVNHYLNAEILLAALSGVGINLLFFCLTYTLTIIAVMMTGNLIISICGTGVFLLYIPSVRELINSLCISFFATFANYSGSNKSSSFLSPIESYINIATQNIRGNDYIFSIITSVAVTIVLVGVALFLYKKRSSEAAGKSMAFKVSKPIIKFLLVVPLSLGGGILLRSIVTFGYDAWFVFGVIFAFIVSYGLIQVLFEFDIRSVFQHKRQMLLSAVIIAVIALVLRLDVFGYDDYLPEIGEVKSMSVSMTGMDQGLNYYEYVDGNLVYYNAFDYELSRMKLTNVQAAYDLAEMGVKNRIKKGDRNNYNAYYWNNDVYTYYVKYTLKSGREVYRSYGITLEESRNSLSKIYSDQAYKDVHFPIYQWQENDVDEVRVSYNTDILNYDSSGIDAKEGINFSLSGDSLSQLLDIYKAELSGVTLEEAEKEIPVIELSFQMSDYTYDNYYVYPSCIKTLTFLEERGFDVKKRVEPEKVLELTIYNFSKTQEVISKDGVSVVSNVTVEPVSYKEQRDILEILPALVPSEYSQNNRMLINVEENVEVNLTYRFGDSGLVQNFGFSVRKDSLPEQVKKDLGL
ncbi:MAG: hypothetical protein K0S04_171 [Herbinix sp.]|jgi:ABC-2 type transport system permease protein|nr:hypothetical protein [Herbinix sp.]